jgi:glycine cleavage system H protein
MLTVAGYQLDPDRYYDPDYNLWLVGLDQQRVRIGLDPLGADTTGDIVAISFVPVGTRVRRGDALANIEAAKFVGPLPAPAAGVAIATSDRVLDAPGVINADPLGTWLVELGEVDPADLEHLLSGKDAISSWFADAVARFRQLGALAE